MVMTMNPFDTGWWHEPAIKTDAYWPLILILLLVILGGVGFSSGC